MQIYKITNIINKKSYIGKTRNTFHKRYNHRYDWWNAPKTNLALKNAVDKYSSVYFKVEILFEQKDFNLNLLNELEKHYIRLHNTISPYGYNFTRRN